MPGGINFLDCRCKIANVIELSDCQFNSSLAPKLFMTAPNRPETSKPRNMVLRLLGPGLVTGAADDDPSGIATYSQAGAQFGYGLLWTVFLTTPFMIAIQLVSARIGRVTGKGLAANVMELAPRWLVLALIFLLVAANTFNIAADIAAMGESLSLVIGGLNHEHALIFASASTLLQVFVPYRRYAPVLKFMTLTLFAYVATALTVKIPWSTALLAAIWPTPPRNRPCSTPWRPACPEPCRSWRSVCTVSARRIT